MKSGYARTAIAAMMAATFPAVALAQLSSGVAPAPAGDVAADTPDITPDAVRDWGRFSVTLEGQLLRAQSVPGEIYAPSFISAFAPEIDPSRRQHEAFDWGGDGTLSLQWTPQPGLYVSLGVRTGKNKLDDHAILRGQTLTGCSTVAPCAADAAVELVGGVVSRTNYGITQLRESEKHLLADFRVGRDVGIGGLQSSTVSAALRYAHFRSSAQVALYGTPDWQVPEDCLNGVLDQACNKYSKPMQHHEYGGTLDAKRDFEGIGPVLSWDASRRLFGAAGAPHLDLDWSLSGGVLFGKQKAAVERGEEVAYFNLASASELNGGAPVYDTVSPPTVSHRSRSATVPIVALGAGFSYRVGAAGMGLGYRWTRYFDVIDGGIDQHKAYDRTLDGPYLNVQVRFGGHDDAAGE